MCNFEGLFRLHIFYQVLLMLKISTVIFEKPWLRLLPDVDFLLGPVRVIDLHVD